MTSKPLIARVVECFGRRAIVQITDDSNGVNERRPASVFGKRTEIVCGDRVRLEALESSDELQIVEVLPRSSLFTRTDSRGRVEALAANLTLLAVVLAPEPQPDLFIVDRYLAGAAYAGLRTVIIVNKADLLPADSNLLLDYCAAGYQTIQICAKDGNGIDDLRAVLSKEIFLLAGQSGVGKSTISNALTQSQRATRELSTASGEGKHTTVSTAWFEMPNGGALIDSPGVRDYAPPAIADANVQVGWPEIVSRAPNCKFNDCLHLHEPGCAVRAALKTGAISARRYESYKRLLNLMRQLLPSHERR